MEPQVWSTAAVVADVDGSTPAALVTGSVLRAALGGRLPGVAVRLHTLRGETPALRLASGAWRDVGELAAAAPDVVVACGSAARVAVDDLVAHVPVVDTTILDPAEPPVATLLPALLDPVTVDVRRRMLAALGLLPPAGEALDLDALQDIERRFPLTATDLSIVVGAAERVLVDDPALQALATPGLEPAVSVAFDELAAAVIAALPSAPRQLVALADEVARLRAELAAAGATHSAEVARLLGAADAAADRERVLRDRLEQEAVRGDNLLADRQAAPA